MSPELAVSFFVVFVCFSFSCFLLLFFFTGGGWGGGFYDGFYSKHSSTVCSGW